MTQTTPAKTTLVSENRSAKCTMLWTKASHFTVASEFLEDVSHRKLVVLTSTRKESLYDAVSRIIKTKTSLCELYTKQGIKCFKPRSISS